VLRDELGQQAAWEKYHLGWHTLKKILAHPEPSGWQPGGSLLGKKRSDEERHCRTASRNVDAYFMPEVGGAGVVTLAGSSHSILQLGRKGESSTTFVSEIDQYLTAFLEAAKDRAAGFHAI